MSNYPIWWDTTVTIYNKYTDVQTNVVRWYKTVVENCFWKYVGDKVKVNDVTIETDDTICRIPQDIRFLARHIWETKPNDQMGNYFTLGLGDIIVVGEVDDEINEYNKGHRSTDLIAKYKSLQGCIQVKETAINTGLGRCLPHYYAKGN